MKKDDQIRIQYASKQASIANAWKKWIGENLGIKKSGAIQIKRDLEAEFTKRLTSKQQKKDYGNLLPEFEKLYKEFEAINVKRNNYTEVFIRTNELMRMMVFAQQLESSAAKGEETFDKTRLSLLNRLSGMYKNYNVSVDKGVFEGVMLLYTNKVDASIYNTTAFTNLENVQKLLEGSSDEVLKKLNNDDAYRYAKPMILEYLETIDPQWQAINTKINALQKTYMKALMEVMTEQRYVPDANSTLRVTYGKVKGYEPRDAVQYEPVSYLDGVIEKYIPNDYEFDVPQKLMDLYKAKDYGQYADSNGKLPVCFIGTNHTTGGNSGSPAIDAHGNLIGLNFDRVWEGTMSDIYYSPEICRNIMVDVRYVLFIIDKYAGAKHLIDEMKLVHPKSKMVGTN